MQVPWAGGDVEDRVHPGGEVLVELRRALERRPRERRPGQGLLDHPADALHAGLEDGVVDVGDHAEARLRPRDAHLERRGVRLGQSAVGGGQLDARGRRGRGQPVRLGPEPDQEVALRVGERLHARAPDGDAQRDARQLVGEEVPHRALDRRPGPLAVDRLGRHRVVEHAAPDDDALGGAAVAAVRVDAEVLRRAVSGPAEPGAVPCALQTDDPPASSHGHHRRRCTPETVRGAWFVPGGVVPRTSGPSARTRSRHRWPDRRDAASRRRRCPAGRSAS